MNIKPLNADTRRLCEELYEAAYLCRVEDVRRLLETGADASTKCGAAKTTPLHAAVAGRCVDAVDLLMRAGVDVNAKDDFGQTVLHYAASKGDLEIIKRLIATGADINAEENELGYTPLHIALVMSKEEAALELINAGADIVRADRRGQTPLHLAVRKCLVRAVEELLRRGVPVNAVDAEGDTPLHHAVKYCDDFRLRRRIKSLLLNHGADPKIRNKKGLAPTDYKTFDDDYEVKVFARFLRRLSLELSKALEKYQRQSQHNKQVAGANKTMGNAKIKIVVKLKRDGGYVDYEAKVGEYVTLSGYTRGGRDEVRKVIRRALRAERPLPNRVKDIAVNVVRQVLLWIDVYKVEGAAAGMTVDLGEYSDLTIYTVLYYEAAKGWTAELRAVFDGFDGFTDARHRVVETAKLGRKLDDTAADLLLRKLMKVAKHAYNIYVEEEDDKEFDRFDDDDGHSNNDDDSTSLKIWV
jgi:ankyrin repeat protein